MIKFLANVLMQIGDKRRKNYLLKNQDQCKREEMDFFTEQYISVMVDSHTSGGIPEIIIEAA